MYVPVFNILLLHVSASVYLLLTLQSLSKYLLVLCHPSICPLVHTNILHRISVIHCIICLPYLSSLFFSHIRCISAYHQHILRPPRIYFPCTTISFVPIIYMPTIVCDWFHTTLYIQVTISTSLFYFVLPQLHIKITCSSLVFPTYIIFCTQIIVLFRAFSAANFLSSP